MSDSTYQIKPLEWIGLGTRGLYMCSTVSGESYHVRHLDGETAAWRGPHMAWNPCKSIQHGKQLAEQHWRERLLPHLELVDTQSTKGASE